MKTTILRFFLITLVLSTYPLSSINAQVKFAGTTVFKNDDIEIRQIDEHTWHGFGNLVYNESVYLVEGEKYALLIDVGTRIPQLHKIMENIVHKPIILAATHVHPDHTGSAINEWDSIWINAADEVNTPKFLREYKGKKCYLEDGQFFDLGDRKIEVVFTPGHTPGSTTFIDKEAHYGFSGDAFGSTNLLIFTSLSTQIATCQRMLRFINKYDLEFLYPGHSESGYCETPQRLKDEITICERILDGSIKPQKGENQTYVVDKYGVRINFDDKHIR